MRVAIKYSDGQYWMEEGGGTMIPDELWRLYQLHIQDARQWHEIMQTLDSQAWNEINETLIED